MPPSQGDVAILQFQLSCFQDRCGLLYTSYLFDSRSNKTIFFAEIATGLYSAYTVPSDNVSEGMQSDEFVPYERPFTYDRSQNPIDESDLADKLIWDETTYRFTFFKPHLKKGMSCHSTKPFDHSDREKANHSPEILALPHRPTFVDPERAQRCCGNAKKENYRVDCKAFGCLVKCPHPDCGGGVGEQAVRKCATCPLALPALDRMPSHCLCGVRFLTFAPFHLLPVCQSAVSQAGFTEGRVIWTQQQHRLILQTGGFFRRVGARVCDNFGICRELYKFGDDSADYIAEDTFAHSNTVSSASCLHVLLNHT
jgi:hypothetical protein